MSRMVRKQVYLERGQDELLKAKAAEIGLTESELIRRAVDRLAHEPERRLSEGYAEEVRDLDSGSRRTLSWAEALELMDRIAARTKGWRQGKEGRGWTREELYDERLSRVPR